MQQNLQWIVCRLTPNQKKFIAEVAGTFIVVVLATGSVVIDAKFDGALGISFIAFSPFVGVAIGVYLFGKISPHQRNLIHHHGSLDSFYYNYISFHRLHTGETTSCF